MNGVAVQVRQEYKSILVNVGLREKKPANFSGTEDNEPIGVDFNRHKGEDWPNGRLWAKHGEKWLSSPKDETELMGYEPLAKFRLYQRQEEAEAKPLKEGSHEENVSHTNMVQALAEAAALQPRKEKEA